MKYSKTKIGLGILVLILAAVLAYVLMNSSYFIQQIKFTLNKPSIESKVNDSTANEVSTPNQLSIPSLGITAPIVESEQSNEVTFQEALKKGVVHYPGTAAVGELGNAYLFGHSSDLAFKDGDYKSVFALLPRIENGAEIIATNAKGDKFVYVVVNQFVAKSTDVHLLDQNTGGKKVLTVQTSYPIGTALKRYIVVAELVE